MSFDLVCNLAVMAQHDLCFYAVDAVFIADKAFVQSTEFVSAIVAAVIRDEIRKG